MPRKSNEPERQCLVTRQSLSKTEMIRFVLAPDGQVVPDLKMRLPGRGVWVTANRQILEQAVGKGLFARGFKNQSCRLQGSARYGGGSAHTARFECIEHDPKGRTDHHWLCKG